MKYKFKLDGLLKLRQFKEHKGKIELAQINRKILNHEEKVINAEEEIKKTYKQVEAGLERGKESGVLSIYPIYIQAQRNYIKQQKEKLEKMGGEFKQKLQALSELRGGVKVLENMKTREFKQYKRDYRKKIESEIEDVLMAGRVGRGKMRRYGDGI